MMYLAESNDVKSAIDPIPLQGCSDDCHESDRYSGAIAALPFVFVHLTGDYPIIEYNIWARIIVFFMVIGAAGIVSIPTGLIADGFSEVCAKREGTASALRTYDIQYNETGDEAPREFSSDYWDGLQSQVNSILNGDNVGKGV